MAEKIHMDKVSKKALTGEEIATRSSDLNFYSTLDVLPNPDPILRRLGQTEHVFDAIASDAHVMGERRSIRSGLQSFEHRLIPASDSPADTAAFVLCEKVFNRRPSSNMQWSDVLWQKAQAVFRGQSIHELVWSREGAYILPSKIIDRPARRFKYNIDNELRLLTRAASLKGEEVPDYRFLVTRHMPTAENPYGEAVFSSCFWPYTFKHAGYKYFAKFCERYGFPWPIGKYPQGSTPTEISTLTESLANMVEDAVAAIPQGTDVEVIQNSVSGSLVHESLVNLSNKEMSKALTSQTLATEIQGQGSRAASETHRERETTVHKSDRQTIAASMNQIFSWITAINIAGAKPPTFEFYEESEARKGWTDVIDKARSFIEVPKQFAHERLQIPLPEAGEEVLAKPVKNTPAIGSDSNPKPAEFSAPGTAAEEPVIDPLINQQEMAKGSELIGGMVDVIRATLNDATSIADFKEKLSKLYPDINTDAFREHIELGLLFSLLDGADSVEMVHE